jgi:hypothetical protein
MSKIFTYNGDIWMHIVPSKTLFRSTTIHDVITRGDIFAVNLNTRVFTILPREALNESKK